MNASKNHGGKRPNAGRKPKPDKKEILSVSIKPDVKAKLEQAYLKESQGDMGIKCTFSQYVNDLLEFHPDVRKFS
jgi:hypothetical protein